MTKRVMAKKFMRETGADKKTAMEYLRKSNWNYGQAISLYILPDLLKAVKELVDDWTKKFAEMVKSFQVDTSNGSKNKESDLE